jgi:hypothetical protein
MLTFNEISATMIVLKFNKGMQPMTQLTYITESTDLKALFAPYAAPTPDFADKKMNQASKQVKRARYQGKPDNIVNYYINKLVSRAAEIIMLIDIEEYLVVLEVYPEQLSKARKAYVADLKKATDIATSDALIDGLEFSYLETRSPTHSTP